MAEFLHLLIAEFELGSPHLVAPDVGTSAAQFRAARHPDALASLVTGGGSAYPLDVTGALADIIATPDIELFKDQDIRATIGATVAPVAPANVNPMSAKTMAPLTRTAGSPSPPATSAATLRNYRSCRACCRRCEPRSTSSAALTTPWCRPPTAATSPSGCQ